VSDYELIYAVIPAYNASKTLKPVIQGLRTSGIITKIVVVNDGSTDNTQDLIKQLNVENIVHPQNLGKGAALKSGFRWANSKNADLILTIDADGQHNPCDVEKLLGKMSLENADIVIGSRRTDLKNMPFHRITSNLITSKLISWRIKQKVEDSQSGFRIIRTNVFKTVKLTANKYDLESELIIKAGLTNFKIVTVPVETIYKKHLKSSVQFLDVFRFIALFLRSLMWKRMN
jgi:glycosyltransferase involved in cell wall biosynthesis